MDADRASRTAVLLCQGRAAADGRADTRARWVGTYVISYRDGQPDYIHVCGYSGD